jgi:hypothetical protein
MLKVTNPFYADLTEAYRKNDQVKIKELEEQSRGFIESMKNDLEESTQKAETTLTETESKKCDDRKIMRQIYAESIQMNRTIHSLLKRNVQLKKECRDFFEARAKIKAKEDDGL